MFNLLKSNKEIPEKIGIYSTERINLDTRLKSIRSSYFKKGWNVLTLGNKLGFFAIDTNNLNSIPPILENCLKDDSSFDKDIYKWNENLENQNQFIHALFSSLKYNILKFKKANTFVTAEEVGLQFKRDFLKSESIFSTNSYDVFEGIQFVPSLVKKNSKLLISFICRRVIRINGRVKGSPRELQRLSQLSTSNYFKKLSSLLQELIGNRIKCTFGNLSFEIENKLEPLKVKDIKDLKRTKLTSEGNIREYSEDFIYLEEIEEEMYEEIEEEDLNILENELIEYIFPIIPLKIEYGVLEEPPLWVGGNQRVSNYITLYLLNQYGPYYTPKRKVVFIPLYPEDQPHIKEKISKVASLIISGSGSGKYDFPGLIKGFNLKINLVNPKPISLNLTKQDFERKIVNTLKDIEREVPHLPSKFKLTSSLVPFFLIGFEENIQKEWGKFTPIYQYFKENLIGLGYPNQIIKSFGQFFGNYKTYPLWSSSSAIFSKLGGIPWQIEANLAKNGTSIDVIIGFRFARQKTKDKNQFVLGIATIFSGNGKYLGFKTKNIPIDNIGENYKFILKSHGYSRRYEGLKIPAEKVKELFSDAEKIIDKSDYHQKNPGAVVVHRLGSVSSEEADAFLECFNSSKYSAGALVSVSEHPLRWSFNGKTVTRGTWINLNKNSGILFPQGLTNYYQGYYPKPFKPKSIPRAFKITIMRDNGVYEKPHAAGYDVMALSRMNWRHTTFIPSNYPISLQYSLIIAQYFKNNIIPSGDLNETAWFL